MESKGFKRTRVIRLRPLSFCGQHVKEECWEAWGGWGVGTSTAQGGFWTHRRDASSLAKRLSCPSLLSLSSFPSYFVTGMRPSASFTTRLM